MSSKNKTKQKKTDNFFIIYFIIKYIINMPNKLDNSNRERKKESKKSKTDANIYSSKHIRLKEELQTKLYKNSKQIKKRR